MSWSQDDRDRDGDGLSDNEESLFGTDVSLPDTDGDGLLDSWEVRGYSVGGYVEPLHLYGANPLVKDVFVEIDWMASANGDPESEEANALCVYQAAVDVTRAFRDSGTGIQIHFDLGPDILERIPEDAIEPDVDFEVFATAPDSGKTLPYQTRFPGRPTLATGEKSASSALSLYEVANDPTYFRVSRRHLFYYVVFAEQSAPPGMTGAGGDADYHPFVDDFADEAARRDGLFPTGSHVGVVYRYPRPDYEDARRLRYHYSVSLFHELGHAFGLGHGGSLPGNRWDNTNFKVNYPSIMNHRYQFWGVDSRNGIPVMDFSHGQLGPVSELELYEPIGLGAAVSDHLLSNLNVSRVPDRSFPLNVDWNRDGRVTVTLIRDDLNQNGLIDPEVSTDHDDWGKLSRDGFDGIGWRTFSGCGVSCDLRIPVECAHGDYNGDGLTDLFFASATRMAWSLGGAEGPRSFRSLPDALPLVDGLALHPHQRFVAGDFRGVGRDMLAWQRPGILTVVEYAERAPYVVVESLAEVAAATPTDSAWSLEGPPQTLLPLRLTGAGQQLVVTDGRHVAVLAVIERDDEWLLVTAWRREFLAPTAPRALTIQEGRTFSDGIQSIFVFTPEGRFEVRFASAGLDPEGRPVRAPNVRRLQLADILARREGDDEDFPIDDTTALLTIDVDGDRVEELVIFGGGRLALARWTDHELRLVWKATSVLAGWSLDASWNRLYHAQFVAGAGEELVLSNGRVWITLGGDPKEGLQVLAVNIGELDAGTLVPVGTTWPLHPEQRVFPGKFVQGSPDGLLVFNGSGIALAAFDPNPLDSAQGEPLPMTGFRVLHHSPTRAGEWFFGEADRLRAVQGDNDSQSEILVQKADTFGVLDLRPANRVASSFVRRWNSEEMAFESVQEFRRADVNLDGGVDISDASRFLAFLFLDGDALVCEDSADANDSGRMDLADAVFILSFLFLDRMLPPEPGPDVPGMDPTLDALGCEG